MQDRFDPHLQWLDLQPAGHPLDHYQLLQLDRFESDAEVIALAADRSMAQVRGQRPGEHLAQWQRLLDELAAAKACLTDAARKVAYDERLIAGPVSHPRPAPVLESSRPSLSPAAPEKRSRHVIGFAAVLVGSLLVAATAALIMSKFKAGADQTVAERPIDKNSGPQAERKAASAVPSPSSAPTKTAESKAQPTGQPTGPTATPIPKQPDLPKQPSIASTPSTETPPNAPPDRPTTGPTPVRPSQDVPPPSSVTPGTKPPPATPDPTLTPMPKIDPRPTARQIATFDDAVKKTIAAMQRRDSTVAHRNLRVAEKNAISQDQQDRLERVRQLQQYVGEFFKAVRAGYDALKGSEEFVIGGQTMVVVDCTPKEITIRRLGRNQSFPADAMPDSLSLTLARRWFDSTNSTNKVFIGAFQALRGKVDVARELWQQARADGVEQVDFLLPVLDEIPPEGRSKSRQQGDRSGRLTNDE